MEAKYSDVLPAVFRPIVDEIEERCGRELPVQGGIQAEHGRPASWRMYFNLNNALDYRIEHAGDSITPAILAHELLHAYRYLVEGVPMMQFLKAPFEFVPGTCPGSVEYEFSGPALDNLFEHLWICPLQEAYGFAVPDTTDYDQLVRNVIEFSEFQHDTHLRRYFFLFQWVNTKLTPHAGYHDVVREVIEKEKLVDVVRDLERKLLPAMRCKELAISLLVHAFGINPENAWLGYCDARKGIWKSRPMPTAVEVQSDIGQAIITNPRETYRVPLARVW